MKVRYLVIYIFATEVLVHHDTRIGAIDMGNWGGTGTYNTDTGTTLSYYTVIESDSPSDSLSELCMHG
jgi:hypothetical protein